MTPNPDLVVLDLAKVPAWAALDLRTLPDFYQAVLSAETLAHLADCARQREARDAAKLSELLYEGVR